MAQDVTWETTDLTLSEYKEITTLLRKPIRDKRRIKYTCFNVSTNYIALGSNSGGIYLFSRETCVFQQLIPLSNGAVMHILISPDEKVIALATTDGNVCLVVFKPSVRKANLSSKSERNGECITALCWNANSSELYIGDANGSIHVMGLSIFTVKRGIFQDPACPIMNLDYKIVQMDFYSSLLLISTTSDCYICDTIEGQYEKVGVRTRQGEFGACFYKPQVEKNLEASKIVQKHSLSSSGNLEEAFLDSDDRVHARIYCARPGSRLWEAKTNGKIVKTHNFKEALAIAPCIVQKRDARSPCVKPPENDWPPQSLKFSPLRIVAGEYLFTYNTNALYILDHVNSTVILWNDEYKDIAMADVIQNYIYLMTNSGDFHCLNLRSTNLKMSNVYSKLNPNKFTGKLNSGIVIVNQNKFTQQNDIRNEEDSLPAELNEELDKSNIESLTKKNLITENLDFKKTVESLDETELDGNCTNIDEKQVDVTVKNIDSKTLNVTEEKINLSKDEISNLINDVQIIYSLANTINDTMSDNEIDAIIEALEKVITSVKQSYQELTDPKPSVFRAIETAEQYYINIFLSKLSKVQVIKTQSQCILNQITSSFISINMADQTNCECGFPHPITKLEEPKFFHIGAAIIEKYSNISQNACVSLCKKVPYMWRVYVQIYGKRDDFLNETIFAQCLQTRDDIILSFILLSLSKSEWQFTKRAITSLKLKRCILCNGQIKEGVNRNDYLINWNNVANEIMKREGPDVALNFVSTIITMLPPVCLNRSLFQSLIFTKIMNNHGFKCPVNFNQKLHQSPYDKYSSLCCPKIQNQVLETLEKDLNRRLTKDVFGTQAHHWGMHYKPLNSICPCCTLPLQTPVLLDNNGLSLFPCGHSYHANCLIQKKIFKCNLHT